MQGQVGGRRQQRLQRVAEFHEAHQQHQRHAEQRAHVGREIQQRRHRAPQQCVLQADAEQHQDAGNHQPDQGIDHADGPHVARDLALDRTQDVAGKALFCP
ncbi:hypothetical protein G6F61_014927 [Rhizopus arrhizus]|nr:hypothetical protein G6F61_014927 [Rhizopus arrhizus]